MKELKDYLEHLRVARNLSPASIASYERDLADFLTFTMQQLDYLGRQQI